MVGKQSAHNIVHHPALVSTNIMHHYASLTTLVLAVSSALSSIVQVSSFIVHPTSSHSHRAVTHLNLENHIAEM